MEGEIVLKPEVNYNLKSLSFAITNKCNLKCSFCSRDSGISQINHIEPSTIEKIIDDTQKFTNIEVVNLSGGEPFLHLNLEEIFKVIYE